MGHIPSVEAQLDNALGTIENLRKRIAELERALQKIADEAYEPIGESWSLAAAEIAREALTSVKR